MFDYSNNDLMYKLAEFESHPLSSLYREFNIELAEDIIYSSYLYLGKTKESSPRIIAILHYHSSLQSNLLFADMQNLHSYEKLGLETKEKVYLCMNVVRDSVLDLSKQNALNHSLLKQLSTVDMFVLADELGNAHKIAWIDA